MLESGLELIWTALRTTPLTRRSARE